MERLTNRDEYGRGQIADFTTATMADIYEVLPLKDIDELENVINKLAAYEDAEENGTLVKLPCNPDDTMWCEIDHSTRNHWFISVGVYKCTVDNFAINKYGTYANITITRNLEWHLEPDVTKLCVRADTVFLTREEAEKALKERGSE